MVKKMLAVTAAVVVGLVALSAGAGPASAGSDVCRPDLYTITPAGPGIASVNVAVQFQDAYYCGGGTIEVTNTTTGQRLDAGTLGRGASYNRDFSAPIGSTVQLNVNSYVTYAPGDPYVVSVTVPAATTPSLPGDLVAVTATATTVTLQWTVPASDGGAPITGYTLSWPGSAVSTTQLQATATGLTPGRRYSFAVAAANSAGTGNQATVTAATVSPTPTPTPSPTPSPTPTPTPTPKPTPTPTPKPSPTPTPKPTPVPVPISPQPLTIAPVTSGNGGNDNGTHNADADSRSLQQTTKAQWPLGHLVSGQANLSIAAGTLKTNAGQFVRIAVTAKSPSVKKASVIFDGRRYFLSAVLKPGKRSGSIVVTAFAPAVTVGGQPYELLQASRRYSVRRH